MSKQFKAIIFDLGGVIEKIDPSAVERSFKKIGFEKAREFFNLFSQSEFCSLFELGSVGKKDFLERLKLECFDGVSAELIEDAWCSNQLGVSSETLDVLDKLAKSDIALFLLSNTNVIHVQHVNNSFTQRYRRKFESIFSKVFYSFEMRVRKPDEKAYVQVLDYANVSPEQCIYIDDLKENLVVPKKLGITVIHHETNSEISSHSIISDAIALIS